MIVLVLINMAMCICECLRICLLASLTACLPVFDCLPACVCLPPVAQAPRADAAAAPAVQVRPKAHQTEKAQQQQGQQAPTTPEDTSKNNGPGSDDDWGKRWPGWYGGGSGESHDGGDQENWKEKTSAQRMHNSWWEDSRDWGWDESHDGDDREKWNKKECAEPGTWPASRDSSSSSAAIEMSHKPASHAEDTGAAACSSCEEASGSACAAATLPPSPPTLTGAVAAAQKGSSEELPFYKELHEIRGPPVLGVDVPWFGIPKTEKATEWDIDSSFTPSKDFLMSHGIFLHPKDGHVFCGYCRDYVKDGADGVRRHLDGYSKGSKTHFKMIEHFKEQCRRLGERGWELQVEGMVINRACFSCDPCRLIGKWDAALEHLDSKAHKKKLSDVGMSLEVIEGMKKHVLVEEKKKWAEIWPQLPRTQPALPAEPSSQPHQQTVKKRQSPARATAQVPSFMEQLPAPSEAELETTAARAERCHYPSLPLPLHWGKDFGKSGIGIWCSECSSWVGWVKYGSECQTDDDGRCFHYGREQKRSLRDDAVSAWGLHLPDK